MGKVVLSSVFLVSVTPIAMYLGPPQIDFNDLRRTNYGFHETCQSSTHFVASPLCKSDGIPNLMVWGDSFAMHLVAGLETEWRRGGVIQATKGQCGPFLGLAPRQIVMPGRANDFIDQTWAEGCIGFNQSVLDFLKRTPSIEIVVLSSPLAQYLTLENYEHVIQRGEGYSSVPVTTDRALSALRRTVQEIRMLGKKVILFAPPPSSNFNIGGCLERQLSGAVAFGGRHECKINYAEYISARAAVLEFLKSFELETQTGVISFDPWLCDLISCKTILDGTMLYRDSGHLSYSGSKVLARKMDWGNLVSDTAK